MESKKYAAIDIGSNAMRAAIAELADGKLKVTENLREPVRLGEDVFQYGLITNPKIEILQETLTKWTDYIRSHGISNIKTIATSAMRNAKNSAAVVSSVYENARVNIEIVSGEEEARLIQKAISHYLDLSGHHSLLLDIGGGSVELSLLDNEVPIAWQSFSIGTVRLLQLEESQRKELVKNELQNMYEFIDSHPYEFSAFVGTGGNLRRMGKLRKKLLGKENIEKIKFDELTEIYQEIKSLDIKQRIKKLGMRPDRADVIVPACKIVLKLMKELKIEEIHMPNLGLKEGILLSQI